MFWGPVKACNCVGDGNGLFSPVFSNLGAATLAGGLPSYEYKLCIVEPTAWGLGPVCAGTGWTRLLGYPNTDPPPLNLFSNDCAIILWF